MTTTPREPRTPPVDPQGDPEVNPIDPLAPGEEEPGMPPEPTPTTEPNQRAEVGA